MTIGLISIAAFVFMATLVAGIYFVTKDFGKTSEEERLESLTSRRNDESEAQNLFKGEILKETASGASSLMKGVGRKFMGLGTYLEQADCRMSQEMFLCLILAGMG